VLLAVSDTGTGMDQQTQERIFEPFFTTKEKGKGTGLGLATVYGIVKRSGGYIWVYSEPGHGTTFKIYLPRTEDERPKTVEPVSNAGSHVADRLLLVVEDDPILRKIFTKMLEKKGYRVRTASSGDDALALVEKEKLRPDLLITDVIMPGMDGRTLVEKMQSILKDQKVLYMSGYTGDAIVHHGILDPGTHFIQKPFSVDELDLKIQELLAGR
jgi:CheY-like chemotaxis protein